MAVQNNANIGFEKQIWDAACVLWGHISAAEYRIEGYRRTYFSALHIKCI